MLLFSCGGLEGNDGECPVGDDSCFAEEQDCATEIEVNIPESGVDDAFLEGYLQALVDLHYYESDVGVKVVDGHVYLSNLPRNTLLRRSIITFVCDHPCVKSVQEEECCDGCAGCNPCCVNRIWLPQNTVLFAPLVADPRQISYSVGVRFNDQATSDRAIAVSFGDLFPLVRWRKVGLWCGDMQLDVEAGAFAVFDGDQKSHPLINIDFYLGFPLTYAINQWSFRLRVWHVSAHLGDEFIINNPGVQRLNVSREGVDLFASYQLTSSIRFYGGIGTVIHEDEQFEREKGYLEYGAELRLLRASSCYCQLYGTPFLAMHFRHWRDSVDQEYDNNSTYALGYEWSKLSGVGRKVRIFLEYHEGFSLEGQFSRVQTEYLAARISYGF